MDICLDGLSGGSGAVLQERTYDRGYYRIFPAWKAKRESRKNIDQDHQNDLLGFPGHRFLLFGIVYDIRRQPICGFIRAFQSLSQRGLAGIDSHYAYFGADGFAADAATAVEMVAELLGGKST